MVLFQYKRKSKTYGMWGGIVVASNNRAKRLHFQILEKFISEAYLHRFVYLKGRRIAAHFIRVDVPSQVYSPCSLPLCSP